MNCVRTSARLARSTGTALLLSAVLLLWGVASSAEIYRCVGPDGKTSFTSDRAQCAGAEPHELKRDIQVEQRPTERSAARSRRRAPAARAPRAGGDERMWRQKKAKAVSRLAATEKHWTRRREMVKACNRGHEWWGKDPSGIRRKIPCDTLRSELAELTQQRDELQQYLQSGLAQECRRAGCLPGWLR
jgi:hypothetical protein